MDACRIFLERDLLILRKERERVAELGAVESGSEILPSSEDLLDKYRALLLLRARKKLLRIDIDRMMLDKHPDGKNTRFNLSSSYSKLFFLNGTILAW